jgi:hypothetical protein
MNEDITDLDLEFARLHTLPPEKRSAVLEFKAQLREWTEDYLSQDAKPRDFLLSLFDLDWDRDEIRVTVSVDLKFKFVRQSDGIEIVERVG